MHNCVFLIQSTEMAESTQMAYASVKKSFSQQTLHLVMLNILSLTYDIWKQTISVEQIQSDTQHV